MVNYFRSKILGILGNLGISSRVGILGISFRVGISHFRHSSQSGLAYVAILVLLAVVSTLAMAFLYKAGTLRAVTLNRLAGMQAGYLAEAAANHATWRLLNDPDFPASETVYYMHDLGTGRYGYKVRKPTLTTFASVATVGAVGGAVVKQSYVPHIKPENILTVYDRNDPVPKYRQLLGAGWGPRTDTLNDGAAGAQWMVLKGCPTRKEFIMGTLDTDQDINFAVWNSSAWGNLIEFTQDAGSADFRPFDIAYENSTGRALVVGRYDGSTDVRYNIWDGIVWSATQNAFSIGDGQQLTYLTMASKPGSDEILIAAVTGQNDLKVVQWDGLAFNDKGVIDSDLHGNAYGIVDIVYEQHSGDALVIWSRTGDGKFYYSVYNGISLSPAQPGRNLIDPFKVVRAAADPASDFIFIATLNSSNGLYAAVWDGNTWLNSRQLDSSTIGNAGQIMDVAWEQAGQDVVVAWTSAGSSNNVTYLTWQKGTALPASPVRLGPALGAQGGPVRLLPVSGTHKIILLAKNGDNHLRYTLWNGSGFSGNPGIQLDSNLSFGALDFDAAESGVPYTGGAG